LGRVSLIFSSNFRAGPCFVVLRSPKNIAALFIMFFFLFYLDFPWVSLRPLSVSPVSYWNFFFFPDPLPVFGFPSPPFTRPHCSVSCRSSFSQFLIGPRAVLFFPITVPRFFLCIGSIPPCGPLDFPFFFVTTTPHNERFLWGLLYSLTY